ncbi:hypothetical protein LVJ94_35045 [Pendulispora rubella]|uniref:Tetratricopeptide repeat protein n=1 Tax=Pendulispora rubella TaxID=2741070 RepID=A0ABZ2KTT4_9BACT
MLAILSVSSAAVGQSRNAPEYDEGIRLFDAGNYGDAADKFAAALAAKGEAKSLWSLSLAEVRAERPLRALEHLRQYQRRPDAKPENVRRAERLIAELQSRVGHLRIIAPDGAVISVDEKVVGTAPLIAPLDVTPNEEHSIDAQLGAKIGDAKRVAAPGEELIVNLVLREVPAAAAIQPPSVTREPALAPAPKPPERVELQASSPALFHTLVITTFVSSFALGGVGAYLYMCHPDCGDHRVLGGALLGTGVAMHIGGYVLYAAWPRRPHVVTESRLGIAPSALPGGAGVTVVGAF